MVRIAALLLILLLPAGCADHSASGSPSGDLQWQTSLRGEAVRVILFDRTGRYRVDRVVLVGPAGEQLPAREITRESGTTDNDLGVGLGGGYGSRSGGALGLGLSLPLGSGGGASLERRTVAMVPLPDPAGYRQTASRWHIEVSLSTPSGAPYNASLPAPTP